VFIAIPVGMNYTPSSTYCDKNATGKAVKNAGLSMANNEFQRDKCRVRPARIAGGSGTTRGDADSAGVGFDLACGDTDSTKIARDMSRSGSDFTSVGPNFGEIGSNAWQNASDLTQIRSDLSRNGSDFCKIAGDHWKISRAKSKIAINRSHCG
jgi:hypothetical protein